MKRIILTLSLLVITLSAGAWNNLTFATIATLASKHLSTEAARATKQVLGDDLAVQNITEQPLLLLNLDENYAPLGSENDALVVAKECVARLEKNKKDGEAILLLGKAIADMHNIANVRIQGHEFSNKDFTISRWNNREGKMARYKKCSWHFLWNSYYSSRNRILTPELYAEDTDLYCGSRHSDYVQGDLDAWASDMGKESRAVYSRQLVDEQVFRQEEINEFDFIHTRLMAKAAYRLAAVLNEIYK